MNYIWSLDELARLCRHKKAVVREWAFERLTLLYPENAGDIALNLIKDNDRYVAETAVDYFSDHPDKRYADDLLNLYRTATGVIAGRIAAALSKLPDDRLINAFKEKYPPEKEKDVLAYPLSVFHIASLDIKEAKEIAVESLKAITDEKDFGNSMSPTLFFANLRAGTDIGVLLKFCFEQPDNHELFIKLMMELGTYCGSWYSEDSYRKKENDDRLPYVIRDSLEYIELQGHRDLKANLERLFKAGEYAGLVKEVSTAASALIEEIKKQYGAEAFDKWLKDKGRPRQNISAIYAFRDAVDVSPGSFKRIIAETALTVFARLIEYRGAIGLDIDGMNTDDMLKIFLGERGDIEEDEKLMERLIGPGANEKIIDRCLNHLREKRDSWAASRAVRLIGKFKDANTVGQLLEINIDYAGLLTDVTHAIGTLGAASAVGVIGAIFKKFDAGELSDQKISVALRALEDIPLNAAADIVIKHWDRFMAVNKESLLEAVRGIGDRRFIDQLRKEIKEGGVLESEIFSLLCIINKVSDPLLKKAEQYIDRHNRKAARRASMIGSSDIGRLLREPIMVELKCRACKRQYNYDVKKIMIDSETSDQYIVDKITCRNCGAVDNYEITTKGAFSITSHLMFVMMDEDIDREDLDESTLVFGRLSPLDGKAMTVAEGVAYYERKIKDNPGNPEYLVGYGNILRAGKRTEEAISIYKEALAVDPLAMEAYVSLGQIAENKKNDRSAYEYYKKASAIINSANFYRVKQDLDQFKEAALNSVVHLEKKLGIKTAHIPAPVKTAMSEAPVKFPPAGRNDPCPCGSGKKYKKCCLQKESIKKSPYILPKEKDITARLMSYSGQDKFKKEFLKASAIYWRTEPVEPLILPDSALEDKGDFIEWFVNDYFLPSGRTIIEDFYAEKFSALSDGEKAVLDSHIMSYMSLYEILEVIAGEGFRVKELVTGRELDIKEVKGSQQLAKWDIIAAKVYTLNGITRILSSTIQTIPRHMKVGLMEFLNGELEKFGQETGKSDWPAFMKKRSYVILHFLEDAPEEKKVFLTEERHKMIFAKSLFDLKDIEEALYLFEGEYDFVIDEAATGKEARLTWLKRGKSKEWKECEELHKKGLVMQSKWIHESGQLEFTVMGSINMTPGKLTLECSSRERLERGKQRLQEILDDLLIHKFDTFEDVDKALERSKATGKRGKDTGLSESHKFIMQQQAGRHMKNWIDENIPALNGASPREAVKTHEGKLKVFELIKDIENIEERKKKEGKPYLDLSMIKRELGL